MFVFKAILTATFLLTALFMNAQTSQKLTPKCPKCNLEKWDCTRKTEFLTLKNPILNDWIQFDWTTNTVKIKGVKEPYPILNYRASVSEPQESIWFSVFKCTIFYGERNQYIGHRLESLIKE